MDHAIQISGVTKSFRGRVVLDDVTLEVPRGVVFALLGENGAGKTTLIRSMLGYHRLDRGQIKVLGMESHTQALKIRRAAGYVSDSHEQYEWMTVGEVGWFASGFYPKGFIARFNELASGFDLPVSTKLRDLSKGMRAKVSLALAMAFDPELLILDEPTSGLDPLVRKSFLESMIDRAAAGQTVFLSSHQISEVERVADWVAILWKSKLRLCAPLDELKQDLQRITLSQRDPLMVVPSEFGALEVLSSHQSGRTWQLVVRGDCTAVVRACSADENVLDIEVSRPSLEELYLAVASGHHTPLQVGNSTKSTDVLAV